MTLKIFFCAASAALLTFSAYSAPKSAISAITSQGRHVTVTAINPHILKISNRTADESVHKSTAVRLFTTATECAISSSGTNRIITTTAGITAILDTITGAVTVDGGIPRIIADNGVRITHSSTTKELSLYTMGTAAYYGAGERGYGLNLLGDTLVMYNKQNYGYTAGEPRIKQMNISMPFIISSQGYGVFFDDYSAATLAVSNGILTYTTEGQDAIDYFYIDGNGSVANVVEQWTSLVGRQQIPPLWSLGYITSKYGYKTEAETRSVIDSLKRGGYPLDGVVLDLYWYGKEEDMGRLEWDPEQWPNHKKMLQDFKKAGVNTVIISQPYVLSNGRGADNFNYLSSHGMLAKDSLGGTQPVKIWVGEGGMLDVSNPDTRAWMRNRYKDLTDGGVTGWWGDLGEPEVHPEDSRHANGLTAREYHNQYGNDWSEIIYNLFTEEYPDTRLMTMMRGGTAGLQRYNVFPWSTDVSRSWGGLKPQIPIMLNSGMSGLGYMSHDVGGFAVDPANPVDPELYVRWLQLGTFSPVLRTHSTVDAEPYHYPAQEPILKRFIKERYKWLPYNYTLAYENATKGWPLVRPMNFYSNASSLDNVDDQYLWGRDLLVAPMLEQGAAERTVLFPDGIWLDYANPSASPFHGGDTIAYKAPLDILPRFVRAGAFIPQADYEMRNTTDYKTDNYTINYYPMDGVKSDGLIYEDNLSDPRAIDNGAYRLISLSGNEAGNSISITAESTGNYPGASANKTLTFRLHRISIKPKEIKVSGRTISASRWKFNAEDHTLLLSQKWNTSAPLNIEITL